MAKRRVKVKKYQRVKSGKRENVRAHTREINSVSLNGEEIKKIRNGKSKKIIRPITNLESFYNGLTEEEKWKLLELIDYPDLKVWERIRFIKNPKLRKLTEGDYNDFVNHMPNNKEKIVENLRLIELWREDKTLSPLSVKIFDFMSKYDMMDYESIVLTFDKESKQAISVAVSDLKRKNLIGYDSWDRRYYPTPRKAKRVLKDSRMRYEKSIKSV